MHECGIEMRRETVRNESESFFQCLERRLVISAIFPGKARAAEFCQYAATVESFVCPPCQNFCIAQHNSRVAKHSQVWLKPNEEISPQQQSFYWPNKPVQNLWKKSIPTSSNAWVNLFFFLQCTKKIHTGASGGGLIATSYGCVHMLVLAQRWIEFLLICCFF